MWSRPILSPHTGLADVGGSRLSRAAPPAQARYIRDPHGESKYFARVDIQDVPRESLEVYTQQNLVILYAKLENRVTAGGRRTHEWRRELRLPSNVNLSSLRCTFVEPGFVHIEADVLEETAHLGPIPNWSRPKSPDVHKFPANDWSRPQTPNLGITPVPYRPECRIDHRRVTFAEPQRCRISTIPSASRSSWKRVPVTEWSYGHSSPISFNSPRNVRTFLSPQLHTSPLVPQTPPTSTRSRDPTSPARIRNLLGQGDATATSTGQALKRYKLRVELGYSVSPRDLTINSHNGLLTIHAKKLVKANAWKPGEDMVFEHYSEHTLPCDIILTDLTARLQDGVVYVEAPYKPVTANISLPRLNALHRQSMIMNNWHGI
ncbi:hypothetical protein CRM22_000843 [Opisthorchis felineus]|uniref:SHSP domain-containing protein n=1 Tax=Opisthorchis felineus TaxID=147828 RepID=A0A4S2MJZ6_OPIFE|nr:hypothetical protein CRM22_000843 [Opisthorchis felineus]